MSCVSLRMKCRVEEFWKVKCSISWRSEVSVVYSSSLCFARNLHLGFGCDPNLSTWTTTSRYLSKLPGSSHRFYISHVATLGSQLWIVSSTSYTVNHNCRKCDAAFYHQDSRFDGNNGYILNEKIAHRWLSIAQSPKCLVSSLITSVFITACRLQSDCDRAPNCWLKKNRIMRIENQIQG